MSPFESAFYFTFKLAPLRRSSPASLRRSVTRPTGNINERVLSTHNSPSSRCEFDDCFQRAMVVYAFMPPGGCSAIAVVHARRLSAANGRPLQRGLAVKSLRSRSVDCRPARPPAPTAAHEDRQVAIYIRGKSFFLVWQCLIAKPRSFWIYALNVLVAASMSKFNI